MTNYNNPSDNQGYDSKNTDNANKPEKKSWGSDTSKKVEVPSQPIPEMSGQKNNQGQTSGQPQSTNYGKKDEVKKDEQKPGTTYKSEESKSC